MRATYRKRIALSKEHADQEVRSFARGIAHHGPENLIESVRQRMSIALDRDYAVTL